ncbi:GNAT family N-acetyltransferase [bacterium]|nr:MAG: GNAT family N-acetyltransferase [bacterium]
MIVIESVNPTEEAEALGEILRACVEGGASVNFVLPFSQAEASAYWRTVKGRTVLLARSEGRALGTVSLAPAHQPNQPHRAEVAKMLVHPDGRRKGIARRLLEELEAVAREQGITLLTLDTEAGGDAENLYRSMGYTMVGTIPDFALDAAGASFVAATFYYKVL